MKSFSWKTISSCILFRICVIWLDSFDWKRNSRYDGNSLAAQLRQMGYSFMLRLRQIDLLFHIIVIECPYSCIPCIPCIPMYTLYTQYTLYTLYAHVYPVYFVYPVYPCIPFIPCVYRVYKVYDKQSITITWRIYLFGVSVAGKNNRQMESALSAKNLFCDVRFYLNDRAVFIWVSKSNWFCTFYTMRLA